MHPPPNFPPSVPPGAAPSARAPRGATAPIGPSPARHDMALPAGHRLGVFEFERVIARSATGIVYLGTDQALGMPVALKEFLPARLVERNTRGEVYPRESWQEDEFMRGLHTFKDEARTLARCDHPSLVRVLHLLEVNGTAYRVMPYYSGAHLADLRHAMSSPPDEAALRSLLDALLGALEAYHRVGGAHGAVTPANIMLLDDGRPLLLGPGAANHAVASELVESWLVHLKRSFAPPGAPPPAADTPAEIAADLHALAEVARFCITGAPANATAAGLEAPRETLVDWQRGAGARLPRYSEGLLRALDAATSARPQDWPASVAQFRAWLDEPTSAKGEARRAAVAAAESTADLAAFDDELGRPGVAAVPGALGAGPFHATRAERAPASRANLPNVPRAMPHGPHPAEPTITHDGRPLPATARTGAAAESASRQPTQHAADAALDPEWLAQRMAAARPAQRAARRKRLVWLGVGTLALVAAVFGIGSDLWRVGPSIRLDVPSRFTPESSPLRIDRGATPATTSQTTKAAPATSRSGPDASRKLTPASSPTPTRPTVPLQAPASPPATVTTTPPPGGATEPPKPPAATAAAESPNSPVDAPAQVTDAEPALAADNPRAACGTRTQFSLYRCMQAQCSQARWTDHAQCKHLRATDRVD